MVDGIGIFHTILFNILMDSFVGKFLVFLCFGLASLFAKAEVIKYGPFEGLDVSMLSSRCANLFLRANEDFYRVSNGLEPIHVKDEVKIIHLRDGGTRTFISDDYILIIYKRHVSIGDDRSNVRGYVLGPSIKINSSSGCGEIELSNTIFLEVPK